MKNSIFNSILSKLPGTEANIYKLTYLITLIVSFGVIVWMSNSAAISGDEHKYINQSEKVFNYYSSRGENKESVTQKGVDPQHYNSQSFDVIVYTLDKWFKIDDTFRFRHNINAISGWLIALFISLIAFQIMGYKAAIIAFFLLILSPRFIGHSFNNHRDIPLALSFTFTLYILTLFLKNYPKISIKKGLLLIVGIASAYSLRLAGGILLSALTIFYICVNHLFEHKFKELLKKTSFKLFFKYFGASILIAIAGFFLGILIWPFGLEGPIKNSLEVFNASSNLGVSLNQLFEGKLIKSNTIPWYYTPKFILITIPLVSLLGFGLYFITTIYTKFKYFNRIQLFAVLTAILPLIYTTLKTTNDYGGWRHFIFVYPFIILTSAIGILLLLKLLKNKNAILAGAILLVAITIKPAVFIFSQHPYQYVYFNELVGGVQNAYKTFETDYSCNGLLGGANWLKENIIPELGENDTITVVSNYHPATAEYFKDHTDNVKVGYSRYYDKHRTHWDYAIFYCGYITPYQLENDLWPPKGTIYTEEVKGFPIAAVVKRNNYNDIKGFEALKKRNIKEAKQHFKNYLKVNPENEEVLEGYARACLNERKADSTIIYADSALIYNPRQIGALLLKASALNYKKNYKDAANVCSQMIELKETFPEAHYQKGIALNKLNNPNEALKEFQLAIAYKKDYYQAYMETGNIFINYKKYNDAINKIYKKVLSFKKRDAAAIINTAKCYHFLNQNDKAIELLDEISKANQNNLYVVMLRSRIEMEKGNLNNSARLLNMTRNINNNSELSVIRALYSFEANKNALAKQYLEKAVELDNTNREAHELLKRFNVTAKKNVNPTQTAKESIMYSKTNTQKKNVINLLKPN